jgi:hypothetical protein
MTLEVCRSSKSEMPSTGQVFLHLQEINHMSKLIGQMNSFSVKKALPCSKILTPGRRLAEDIRACFILAGLITLPRCKTPIKATRTWRFLLKFFN